MITFEYGMLVLDKNATKEDVIQIDAFAEYVRNQEQERIVKLLEESDSVCNDWAIALIKGENK
jgi:archaellum biogenesis ATPase FlaH